MPDPSLEGVPVLVTGATGFIGGRLAQRLAAEEGARVTGVGRRLEAARWLERDGVVLEEGDLLDAERMAELVWGHELVFHAAAWLGGDPERAHPVNVEATERLVRLAGAADARRFVHVSTVSVYAMEGRTRVDEDTPLATESDSDYARTKALAELRAREAAMETDIELSIVRPAMVYGPRSTIWTLGILEGLQEGKPMLIGDGSGHFHPIYVDNLVDAILLCATHDTAVGETFNVVESPVTWREYVGFHGELIGTEPRSMPLLLARLMALADRIPGVSMPIDDMRLGMALNRIVFETDRIRETLGWTPRIGLDQGLEETAAWLREEGHV